MPVADAPDWTIDDRTRAAGAARRELKALRSARQGASCVDHRIDEQASVVIVLRIEHWSTICEPH